MVRQELDANFINRLANSPEVRPFIKITEGNPALDFSPSLSGDRTFWLSDGGEALASFTRFGASELKIYLMFGRGCRGGLALAAAAQMIAIVEPLADLLWGAIPVENQGALWFARQFGFKRLARATLPEEGDCHLVGRYRNGTVH